MDRFDDIWRNKFQYEDPKSDQWNTPTEKNWDSIVAGIRVANRRKKFFPILFLLLLFSFLGLMYIVGSKTGLFLPENKFTLSEKEREFHGGQTQFYEDLKVAEYFSIPIFSNDDGQEEKTHSIEKNKLSENFENSFTEKSTNFTQPIEQGAGHTYNPPQHPLDEKQLLKSAIISTNSKKLFEEIKSQINEFKDFYQYELQLENKSEKITNPNQNDDFHFAQNESLLNTLPSKIPLSPIELSRDNLLLPITTFTPTKANQNFWSVGLYISPVFWQQTLGRSYTDLLEPFDFNYSKSNFGIRIGIDLNRRLNESFEVYFQPGYSIISGRSGHNSTLVYSIGDETQDDHSNSYNIDMATPFGFAGAEFQLVRKDEIPTQEVKLNPVFDSDFTIQSISIPIGLRYFPIKNYSFKPYFNAGATFNRILRTKNTLTQIRPNHDAFDSKTVKGSVNISDNLRKNNLQISFGLGSYFYLGDHIKLNINYQYSRGLSSINVTEINSNRTQSHELIFSVLKKINKN